MFRLNSQPRIESPDSIMPVFWIRIIGLRPPANRPAAIEQACPSRLTPTRRSDGSACISREPIGLAVWQPYDVGNAVLFHLGQHGLRTEGNCGWFWHPR